MAYKLISKTLMIQNLMSTDLTITCKSRDGKVFDTVIFPNLTVVLRNLERIDFTATEGIDFKTSLYEDNVIDFFSDARTRIQGSGQIFRVRGFNFILSVDGFLNLIPLDIPVSSLTDFVCPLGLSNLIVDGGPGHYVEFYAPRVLIEDGTPQLYKVHIDFNTVGPISGGTGTLLYVSLS